jgi:NAD(P)-dependent dehydrogenase (short-subunit alcohol dehydrogenase family)
VNYLDSKEAAEAVVTSIKAEGGQACSIAGDIAAPTGGAALIRAAKKVGELRALVNNAAIFPRCDLLDTSDAEWDMVMSVNLRGAFLCLRECAKVMIEQRGGGAIVSVSSMAAVRPSARGAHYAAAKAGLIGLTRAAAVELAPYGIRVNAVAPGITDTAQPRGGLTEEQIAQTSTSVPLGHMAQPDDIADVIGFLCSPESRHITGQVIHVNGGQYFG